MEEVLKKIIILDVFILLTFKLIFKSKKLQIDNLFLILLIPIVISALNQSNGLITLINLILSPIEYRLFKIALKYIKININLSPLDLTILVSFVVCLLGDSIISEQIVNLLYEKIIDILLKKIRIYF